MRICKVLRCFPLVAPWFWNRNTWMICFESYYNVLIGSELCWNTVSMCEWVKPDATPTFLLPSPFPFVNVENAYILVSSPSWSKFFRWSQCIVLVKVISKLYCAFWGRDGLTEHFCRFQLYCLFFIFRFYFSWFFFVLVCFANFQPPVGLPPALRCAEPYRHETSLRSKLAHFLAT